tara:strand:+ start:139 stop:516 length:378 start_codon:yes stop_codon:yes gene_type:complete
MRFIKVINDVIIDYHYTLDQLFIECPTAEIYKQPIKMPCKELLRNYNVYPLVTTKKPDGPTDNVVTEVTPIFKDGEWFQQWESRLYTEQEKIFLKDEFDTANRIAVDILLKEAADGVPPRKGVVT